MRWRLYGSLGLCAALAMPSLATAQQVRAGAEFRANTYTANIQRRADVHVKSNGDFIVAWAGFGAQDTGNYGVFGQRFDAAGVPQGAEFGINTYTPSFQFRPLPASDRKGNFVIVWGSLGQDGDAYGVFGQRYDAAGVRVGAEFQVNSFTTGGQGTSYYFLESNTAVSMAPNGNFVVVWGSYYDNQDGSYGGVFGQRFNSSGARVGAEFQINSYTTGYQFGPSVAVRDDNSFVVTWSTMDGASYGISAQRYDAAGAPIGGEFNVPSNTAGPQQASTVRMNAAGEFSVVWTDNSPAGELFARRFDAAGAPVGAQFQVNTYTPGNQYTYSIGMDRRGNFIVNWNQGNDGNGQGIGGRRFSFTGTARDPEYAVDGFTTGNQLESAVSSDDVGNVVSVWTDAVRDGSGQGVFGQRFGGLRPTALRLNPSPGNQVWDPGETAEMRPTWRNINGGPQTFAATLTNLTGPAGATYTLVDGTGNYGTVANGAAAECTDCYSVQVDDPATRPVQHWDASAVESITPDTQGQQKIWSLHIGESFADVSTTSGFYRFIETLFHHGITGGCGGANYCPTNSTTRDQMSVFVLIAKEGAGYLPPACTTPVFNDVPASNPFCRFIEELARRGVVGGCGGGNYCPTDPVTRAQMAVFALRTLDPTLNPPACTTPMFNDVPANDPFCRWIEELARRGVVSGCGGGNYCPNDPVTREQMGVFISATFSLTLYGP
jgi:hypothetical protein